MSTVSVQGQVPVAYPRGLLHDGPMLYWGPGGREPGSRSAERARGLPFGGHRSDRHRHGQNPGCRSEQLVTHADHPFIAAVEVISRGDAAWPEHPQVVLEVGVRELAGGAAGQAAQGRQGPAVSTVESLHLHRAGRRGLLQPRVEGGRASEEGHTPPCTSHLGFVVTTIIWTQRPCRLEKKGDMCREKSAPFSPNGIFTPYGFPAAEEFFVPELRQEEVTLLPRHP